MSDIQSRNWRYALVSIGGSAGAACVVILAARSQSVELALSAMLLLCCTAAALARLAYRDWLNPVSVISAIYALYYFGRPIFILQSGRTSPGARADAYALDSGVTAALASAVWLAVASLACLIGGWIAVRSWATARPVRDVPLDVDATVSSRVVLGIQMSVLLSLTALALLISRAGSLSGYFASLSLRSETLSGVSFLTYAGVPAKVATAFGLVIVLRGSGTKRVKRWVLIGCAVVVVSDLSSGGRAGLLLGSILPAILLVNYVRARLKAAVLAIAATGMLVALLTLGAVLRDAQFQPGRGSLGSYVAARLSNATDSLLGGQESLPVDSLVRLLLARDFGQLQLQHGNTYATVVTWPVPRMLWDGKPFGGGNTWFTSTYVPRFYGSARVESSISFIGEAYSNFGTFGIPVMSALLGGVLALAYTRATASRGSLGILVGYALTLGYAITLIRGDLYHNLPSALLVVVLAALGSRFVTARASSSRRPLGSS